MGLGDFVNNANRPLTDEQANATDEVFYRFAPGGDYRDQVVAEFLKLEPIPLHAQTRQQKLPVEVDRARRPIRNVADATNRTESNVEQRVKQVYAGPGEKDTEIARFATDLKKIGLRYRYLQTKGFTEPTAIILPLLGLDAMAQA